jgi:cellulose synthase/poly-beta-1,6-N-acetylglucosamine synthase-like glycosyltransferase
MKNIEIPYAETRGRRYRFFEILPGLISWIALAFPFFLALISARLTVIFVIAYLLLWFTKAVGLNIRSMQGFRTISRHGKLPWQSMIDDLNAEILPTESKTSKLIPAWHQKNLARYRSNSESLDPREILHAIIVAAYNESVEVIEPTIKAVLESDFDMKKVILVFAYEGRDGAQSEKAVLHLRDKYGAMFSHCITAKHPQTDGEVKGKGGNITFAAKVLEKYLAKQKIKPEQVIVTTLDSDNRPHPKYLAALTYMYAVTPDPLHVSYQPVTMYTNNIWDVPAPMRVIASGSSFWNMVLSMRPHIIRNFSAHAQGMAALIDTDYWSVRTIVEDGHQFWRTYFRYDGNHEVYPVYLPIYQDAVLSSNYRKTIRAQFIQLRRWAWGSSDIAYVADRGFFTKNKVPKLDLILKFSRLLEGHVAWATAPFILFFAAFIPAWISPDDYAANQLPLVASRIQTVALVGIFITLFLSFKTLPPKPKRHKAHRVLFMIAQWVLLPVTTIVFNATAALVSQTRLMFGKYLDNFDVTDKAVIKDDKKRVM